MRYTPGTDVIVEFDGVEHRGEVLDHRHGWVTALMQVDPQADYGSGTNRLAPQQTVCVPDGRVRTAD